MSQFIAIAVILLLRATSVVVNGSDVLVGNIKAEILSENDQFTFTLKPSNVRCDSFLLAFKEFDITGSAQLQMYDQGISSPFFTCVACGSIVPPVFFSSTGLVTININGVGGSTFNPSFFELQYVGQITNPEDVNIDPSHTNFNLTLHMPYGHIRPVLMGGMYLAARSTQAWQITVDALSIKFMIGHLAFTANSSGGCGAKLVIYDGLTTSSPVLFSGCNYLSKPEGFIYTSSGFALVVLESVSDSKLEVDFLVDYIADDELYHCGSATSPDILESNSMTIVDGSKSTNLMRRGEACEWLITPLAESSITLLMHWVSLKPGASVVVYDNNEEGGVVLWDSTETSITVPPPLTSSGNSLYVVYTGNSQLASNFFGFQGDYYSRHADSQGTGSRQELYSMSSAIGVTLPDMVTGMYRESFEYSFLLQPLATVGSLFIVINIINITDCDDSINIYDGITDTAPLLTILCGTKAPYQWIEATSGAALVKFSSDADQYRTGNFDFTFFADGINYHCGFPTNPAVLLSSSMRLTDGSSSSESLYGNQYCEWIIEPSGSFGLVLYFERLDLRGGGTLQVYDGVEASSPLLLDIASVAAVPVLVSSQVSSKMKIVYTSAPQAEGDVAGLGFSATYFYINPAVAGPGSDNIIKLYASSSNSFGLPTPFDSQFAFANNYTFHINPPRTANESLFVQVLTVTMDKCGDFLHVYNSQNTSVALMEFTCDSSQHITLLGHWLQVSEGFIVVEFKSFPGTTTNNSVYTQSSFDIAYFSEGPSQHCGIKSNPGRLEALSMPFSDGSGYDQPMHGGDYCEWIIESRYVTDNGGDAISNYVIEFSSNDLRGGARMFIYDGASAAADLLWSCDSCTEVPDALITSSNVAYIRFYSPSVENINDPFLYIGAGFHANYWAITAADNVPESKDVDSKLMALPEGFSFEANAQPNGTAGWVLGISEDIASMVYVPSYLVIPRQNFDSSSGDLDRTYLNYASKQDKQSPAASCGMVQSSKLTTLQTSSFTVAANQYTENHADTYSSQKRLLAMIESYDAAVFNTENMTAESNPVVAASTCTYIINTGSSMRSASIWIENLNTQVNGRVRVFGGVYGYDAELLDSTGAVGASASFFLPCGRGTILLDSNLNGTEMSTESLLDYHFEMSYQLTPGDNGTHCAQYIDDLYGKKEKENFFVKYSTAFIILFLIAIIFCICVTCPERIPKSWRNMYWRNLNDIKKRYKVARAPRPHPRYTPKIDNLRNKYLLRKGTCCVCQVYPEKVLKLSGCTHVICLDDLNGYICTALGDVSMFPLKCPLHIDGCVSTITPLDAKRVLLEPQYDKFLEFTDRGMYGEGMRCIFCANYVKFPAATKMDQMRCKKCIQSFCIRCKGPWHYGRRCVVDAIDESLESWKVESGAQKCPGCSKLIEKDDPATCHHMIHKISDGIPCCRERTDFCYLCGIEVKPDYPHDELRNPGVNHFPEGVFQRCRTLINKERDIEREFLRKSKRRQNTRAMNRVQPVMYEASGDTLSFTGIDENGTVDLATETVVISSDPFDVMWGDSPVRDRIEAEFSEYA